MTLGVEWLDLFFSGQKNECNHWTKMYESDEIISTDFQEGKIIR